MNSPLLPHLSANSEQMSASLACHEPGISASLDLATTKLISSTSPTSKAPEGSTKSPLLRSTEQTRSDKVASALKSSRFKLHVAFVSPKCLQDGHVHPHQASLNPLLVMAMESMGVQDIIYPSRADTVLGDDMISTEPLPFDYGEVPERGQLYVSPLETA